MTKFTNVYNFLNNPARLFLLLSSVLVIQYTLLTPPFQTPDELHHFYRIYQVSEGQFSPVIHDNRAGGEIPDCFTGMHARFKHCATTPDWKLKLRDLLHTFSVPYSTETKTFQDFPDTAFYTPVSYLPQVLLFSILKHLPISMGAIYYLLRFFCAIIWITSMFFCLKKIPIGKWIFTAVLLLPMQVYMSCSVSGDLVNNCLCFILIALCLDKLYRQSNFTIRNVLVFGLLGVLLVFTKLFYAALLLILFLVPAINFKGFKKKIVMLTFVLLPVLIAAVLRSQFINEHYMTYAGYNPSYRIDANLSPGADYKAQKEFLMQHPGNVPGIVLRSLSEYSDMYLKSYIAQFGRFMDIKIPQWLYILSFAVLIFVAITEINTVHLKVTHRLFFFGLGLFIFSMLILSLYLQWTPVKADLIPGFQGRYLFPVFPLFFLSISGLAIVNTSSRLLLPVFLAVVHFHSGDTLRKRFFRARHFDKTEFVTKEARNTDNFLLTDNKELNIPLGFAQIDTMHQRSGGASIKIPAWADSTCHFTFQDLRKGDHVQVNAYVKGKDVQFVLAGKSETCPNFYLIYGDVTYIDKNGWGSVDIYYRMPEDCPGTQMHFYIRNLTSSDVYIDELDFRLWKKKRD